MGGVNFIIGSKIRICRICLEKKETNRFEGGRKVCKECRKERSRKFYYDNKEKVRERNKQYYQDNKEKILKRNRQWYKNNKKQEQKQQKLYYKDHEEEIKKYQKQWRRDNKEKIKELDKEYAQSLKGRYNVYKNRARKIINILFEISLEQFEKLTSQVCFYCGQFSKNKEHCGIDRVKNDIGYCVENCVSCCTECNYVKSNSTFEEIEKIYFGMKKLLRKK